MNNLSDINRQRQQLLQQKAETEAPELERQRIERERQAALSQIDDQLARLDDQERETYLAQAVERNKAMVNEGAALVDQLLAELDKGVRLLEQISGTPIVGQLEQLRQRQQGNISTAVDAYMGSEPYPWYGRDENSLTYEEKREREAYSRRQRQQETRVYQKFDGQHVPAARQVIAEYIAKSPTPEVRKLRQIMGYIFTDMLLEPSPGYNAAQHNEQQIGRQWNPSRY